MKRGENGYLRHPSNYWQSQAVWRGSPDAGALLPPLQTVGDEQQELWKVVGRATGWKEERCRYMHITELFSLGKRD